MAKNMDAKFDLSQDYIMVAGPTASGKSALAIDLARAFDGVVINADSMQIYQDLSVVTACPDEAEKTQAPHVLYNTLDGAEACSVGKWLKLATAEVERAHQSGKLPILCGGTALYLNAAQHGMSQIPEVPNDIHEQVITEHRERGGQAMLDELAKIDVTLADKLFAGDSQRITRAIEVYRHTKRPLSAWQNDPQIGQLSGRAYNFFISPDRAHLYERINLRFATMWDKGAVDEVIKLRERRLDNKLPVMKAVGVPQIIDYLDGKLSREDAIAEAQMQSRRYAKRQFTFFRNNFITNYTLNETYSKSMDLNFFSNILF